MSMLCRLAVMGVLLLAKNSVMAQDAIPQTSDIRTNDATAQKQQGLTCGKHDANAPINVTSDDFVGDFSTKVGTYVGNVVVIQADCRLKADKVKVEMGKNDPNKFFADGHVVFESTSGVATGDNGIYDLAPPRTLTLNGNVVLTKQKDVMRGTSMVVNLVTGESHLTARGMPGNRVQSLFIPKPQAAKPSKAPQR
ncbi:MAG TPA: LptA/OstA family protein [Rhizomicrobium sp.]